MKPHSRQNTQILTFVWQEEWLFLVSGFSSPLYPQLVKNKKSCFVSQKKLCLVWLFKPGSKFWICNFVKIYRKSFKNSPFLSPFWLVGTGLVPIISQCFPTGYFCVNLETMCQEILLHPKEILYVTRTIRWVWWCLPVTAKHGRKRQGTHDFRIDLATQWNLVWNSITEKNNRPLAKTGMIQLTSLSMLMVVSEGRRYGATLILKCHCL